jgi:hypothetical protein
MIHKIPNLETLGCTWAHLAHPIQTPMLAKMEANIQAETEVIRKIWVHSTQLSETCPPCLEMGEGTTSISHRQMIQAAVFLCNHLVNGTIFRKVSYKTCIWIIPETCCQSKINKQDTWGMIINVCRSSCEAPACKQNWISLADCSTSPYYKISRKSVQGELSYCMRGEYSQRQTAPKRNYELQNTHTACAHAYCHTEWVSKLDHCTVKALDLSCRMVHHAALCKCTVEDSVCWNVILCLHMNGSGRPESYETSLS